MGSGEKRMSFFKGKKLRRAIMAIVLAAAMVFTIYTPQGGLVTTAYASTWATSPKFSSTPNCISTNFQSSCQIFVLDNVGDTCKLRLSGVSGKVTWKSKDKTVAKVNKKTGKVKAKGPGVVTIVAKCNGNKYKCDVWVAGIEESLSSELIEAGDSIRIEDYGVAPNGYTPGGATWESSDPDVAEIGKDAWNFVTLTGKSAGTVTVSMTAGGHTYTREVTIVPAVAIELVSSSYANSPSNREVRWEVDEYGHPCLTMDVGDTAKLTLANSTGDVTWEVTSQTWSAQDNYVISVDQDGNVEALNGGMATITATCGGREFKCYVGVDGWNISNVILRVGETVDIQCYTEDISVSANGATEYMGLHGLGRSWAFLGSQDDSVAKTWKDGSGNTSQPVIATGIGTTTVVYLSPGNFATTDDGKFTHDGKYTAGGIDPNFFICHVTVVADDDPRPSTSTYDPSLDVEPSYEFFDYLNEQRAALGLPELEWSDALYEQCVKEDMENGLMLHTDLDDVAEIILQTYDSDVASWYQDFYDSSSHQKIMLADYSWEHTYNPVTVNGVPQGKAYTESGPGSAACVVCHYGGYYYIRMMFYAG